MDRALVLSYPNPFSITNAGNLWQRKHSTKNIYYASSSVSKGSQYRTKAQIEYNLSRSQQTSLNHQQYKSTGRGPTYQECNRKYVTKAVPIPSFDSESHASSSKNVVDSVKNFFEILCQFIYPYATVARLFCATSASLLAVENLSNISPLFFIGLLQAVVPHVFMDLYITGVNQVFDIEIDKINKPYLPMASGKISFPTGVFIFLSSAILGLWLNLIIGSQPLVWNHILNCLMWTCYSVNVPLLRWKRFPLVTTILMVLNWGFIFPISYFLHMQTFVFKRPIVFPRSLIVSMVFLSIYNVGLAMSKDIPDIEGDKKFGINSFSVRLGQKKVFWICVSLFELAFGVTLVAGALSSSPLPIKIAMGVGNIVLASILWHRTKYVDLANPAYLRSFYMLNWKLLYAAFFLLPLIR